MINRSKNKISVTRRIDADTGRLYGTLDDAITYLQEVKEAHQNASLSENWTGYEDMEMVFEWEGIETDQEFDSRQSILKRVEDTERKQREEDDRKREYEKKIEALKKEYLK